jgi:rubrerythrin
VEGDTAEHQSGQSADYLVDEPSEGSTGCGIYCPALDHLVVTSLPDNSAVLILLDTCHAIELACERLYSALADAHADHPPIASLWRKTAREEQAHAAQFRLLMAGHGAAVEEVAVDRTEALAALQELEATASRIRMQTPTVEEALTFAVRLEERLAKFHADTAAIFHEDSQRRLFRAMMAADDRHTDALREALYDYCGAAVPPSSASRSASGSQSDTSTSTVAEPDDIWGDPKRPRRT